MCVCGQKIILCSSAHNSHNHLQVDLTNPSTQIVTITWHEICVRMNSANVLAARLYIFLLSKYEWTKEKKKLKFEVEWLSCQNFGVLPIYIQSTLTYLDQQTFSLQIYFTFVHNNYEAAHAKKKNDLNKIKWMICWPTTGIWSEKILETVKKFAPKARADT